MKKIFTLFLIASSTFAKAQTACDSLDINVHYFPFNDSFIQVDVYNSNTSTFLSYPVFTIFDSNGDTVALEQMNFFGIAQESHHSLNVFPGAVPGNTFSGTLTLYYQTVDSYAVCTWPMNFNLCPDTCYKVYPQMVNFGGAQVTGDAEWSVLDGNSQVVATGTFTLDTNTQYATDSTCLDPGNYTLKVNNTSLTNGGNKSVSVEAIFINAPNPSTAFNNVDSVALDFDFFEQCIAPNSVKTAVQANGTNIHTYANNIYINNANQPIGEISVYSIDGKKVYFANTRNPYHTLSLPHTGIYIVRVMNKSGATIRKVYIEQ
jgi:hypothetical protein